MSEKKLVVLGIPWDVDTDGLKDYMSKFGDLEDCIVMKVWFGILFIVTGNVTPPTNHDPDRTYRKRERSSGRSRGFGYVTFAEVEDAKAALSAEHFLGNRALEVKIATPKEEMRSSSKKITRIFVARIPLSVTEAAFRSHFEKYGEILDLYMPKDPSTKGHRGIGFITFANADSVDDLMSETHELGGSEVVVDRATPKEDNFRPVSRMPPPPPSSGYGAYNAYVTTRYAALGAPTAYDYPSSVYGRGESARGMGKKIFIGRLPQEASVEDLRLYFGRFGRILDVYIPKDPKRSGHRGFGFVTFADDGVADRVSRRSHEICGQQVAIDSATPVDDGGSSGGSQYLDNPPEPAYGGYGPMRASYGRMYGSLDFDDWGYGGMSGSMGRMGGLGRMGGSMGGLGGGMGGLGGGMGSLGGSMGGGRPSRTDYRRNLDVNLPSRLYVKVSSLPDLIVLLGSISCQFGWSA
ncbi:hypothetical protein M8C21_020645 [Ambrosia artemisiifolia]|uniref:RRM domain-containing protein n=1 Tax=Ambrosia artemisiifolia TaxID=4212 RepID=A0AAD5CUT1_AMBAR|nr:hypothetical protein M8C21_020645 [Ambrosia artemisiifolia]